MTSNNNITKDSIIIVGNGPSVLKHKCGDLIDSFDNVIRINHYKPSSYVGKKMTHFVCSPWNQKYNPTINNLTNHILIWNLIQFKDDIPYSNSEKTTFINVKILNDILVNTFKFGNFPIKPLPSTGIVAILYFILMNEFDKIYIHGFDNLIPHKRLHYFDNVTNNENVHSSQLEKNFITHYLNLGSIIKLKDSEIFKINKSPPIIPKNRIIIQKKNIFTKKKESNKHPTLITNKKK